MTHGLVSACCGLALSLLAGWRVQAQIVQAPSAPWVAPSGGAASTSAPPETRPSSQVKASKQDDLPEAITRQRQALVAQRSVIAQAEAAQQAVCWQKFAVNACLSEARSTRRQALEPLRQQELALNAQERLWRTEQRERRLQGKQTEGRDTP
jgi:hypothetical protein